MGDESIKKALASVWRAPALRSEAGRQDLLCRNLDDIEYFDCQASEAREIFSEPDRFLQRFSIIPSLNVTAFEAPLLKR